MYDKNLETDCLVCVWSSHFIKGYLTSKTMQSQLSSFLLIKERIQTEVGGGGGHVVALRPTLCPKSSGA